MEIRLKRIARKSDYTIGRLYIDGTYFCDTLEDTDRGLRSGMTEAQISHLKTFGKTAIPAGRYRVTWGYSPKFRKYLPQVEDVKGFSGIRIHSGNTAADTLGCILLGKNKVVGMVTSSRVTCAEFNEIIERKHKAKKAIWLTIV